VERQTDKDILLEWETKSRLAQGLAHISDLYVCLQLLTYFTKV
jgi:hypothetical protein